MAVVVVDRRRVVFGVLAGEAPWISRGRNAAGDRQRTERSVLVVRGDIVVGVNDFGDVLVAVVRVIRDGTAVMPYERTRSNGLGRIPDEIVVVGSRSRRTEVRDLEIAVVDKPLIVLRDAATHAVETHRNRVRTLRPEDRTIIAVVFDPPGTRRSFDERLIAVGVVCR